MAGSRPVLYGLADSAGHSQRPRVAPAQPGGKTSRFPIRHVPPTFTHRVRQIGSGFPGEEWARKPAGGSILG